MFILLNFSSSIWEIEIRHNQNKRVDYAGIHICSSKTLQFLKSIAKGEDLYLLLGWKHICKTKNESWLWFDETGT